MIDPASLLDRLMGGGFGWDVATQQGVGSRSDFDKYLHISTLRSKTPLKRIALSDINHLARLHVRACFHRNDRALGAVCNPSFFAGSADPSTPARAGARGFPRCGGTAAGTFGSRSLARACRSVSPWGGFAPRRAPGARALLGRRQLFLRASERFQRLSIGEQISCHFHFGPPYRHVWRCAALFRKPRLSRAATDRHPNDAPWTDLWQSLVLSIEPRVYLAGCGVFLHARIHRPECWMISLFVWRFLLSQEFAFPA